MFVRFSLPRTAQSLVLLIWLTFVPCVQAQRELKDIPDPDPELERRSFIVADGLEVNLFAADPLLAKPIQMNFDEDGRLWIASSEVYPQIKPGQIADDKILVLDDEDRDGQADRTTVFADGLLIPTGVVPGDGGVYVANSTELLHLRDSDHDGREDQRRIVLSGFGTEDTHHLLHTLRWGPDGCLYMNQSIYIHSHVETPFGVKRLNGGGIWRFRPETMQLEVLAYGFVNPWGHHFDDWGQSFATDGAYGEGINYVFPGSVFFSAPGAKRIISGLNPGSPKHCGLEIVGGRHLPDDWQGNMITNDFRAHRVCRFVVSEDLSGYASRQEVEVIKSTHVAFRPIDVKMGPDGAIYIADWYNPIIQHGEVDFRDPRRDLVHGRIWRVTARGRPSVSSPRLSRASIPELVQSLAAPEEWTRLHAKLQLKQRDAREVFPELQRWVTGLDKTDPRYEHHRLEALWVHENLRQPNRELLGELLQSSDHRVRAAAVRTVSHWLNQIHNAPELLRRAVTDDHARVRLEAVRALAAIPTLEAAQTALLTLDRPMDTNLDFALWQAMRDLEAAWLPALSDGRWKLGEQVDHLLFALKAVESPSVVEPLLTLWEKGQVPPDRIDAIVAVVAALGSPAELTRTLDRTLTPDNRTSPDHRAAALNELVQSSRIRKVQPAGDFSRIAGLLDANHPGLQAAAARAAGVWKIEAARARLMELANAGDQADSRVRHAAMEGLAALGGDASREQLATLARSAPLVNDRQQAVTSLIELDPAAAVAHLLPLIREASDEIDLATLTSAILSRNDGVTHFQKGLEGQTLSTDAAKRLIRSVQRSPRPDPGLIEAIRHAGQLASGGWTLTPKLTQELLAEMASHGDPERGEAIFRHPDMQCLKCHAVGGAGGLVGPDLSSIGASAQPDYLIEALLAPNQKIKENYHSVVLETDDGRVLTGIPVRETKTEVILRDAEDRLLTVPLASIEAKQDGRSLMPDGIVDTLTRDELVHVLRFLSELGKIGPYSVGQTPVARRWQTLVWTPESHQRLNRTSFDTAASDDPALTWQPVYSTVAGTLPVEGLAEFQPRNEFPPTSFLRCQLDVTTPGSVRLQVNSTSGLTLWVDGKPTPLAEPLELNLTTGKHVLTFAANRKQRKEPLRLVLDPAVATSGHAQFTLGK